MTINKKKKKAARMTRITINLKGIQAILQEKKIKGERLHKLIDLNAALFFFFFNHENGYLRDNHINLSMYLYKNKMKKKFRFKRPVVSIFCSLQLFRAFRYVRVRQRDGRGTSVDRRLR